LTDYSDFKCLWVSKDELWEMAEKVRSEYWPENTLPVDVEKIVERRIGLDIIPKHMIFREMDIDAYLTIDLMGIIVDYDLYMDEKFSNRIRFSFAHELGHYVLHKEIYNQLPISSPEDWKDFMLNLSDREYGFFEYQANEFAGRLLVPRDELIKEIDNTIQIIKENNLMDFLAEDPIAVLSQMSLSLCKPFGVSYKVIERRVDREELWPPKV